MKKIKIVGILIIFISISLAVLFEYIDNKNTISNELLDTINQQKALLRK